MPLEQKTRKTNNLGYYGNLKWYLQESNQGHKDFQSFALPTELRYLFVKPSKYNCFNTIGKELLKKLIL